MEIQDKMESESEKKIKFFTKYYRFMPNTKCFNKIPVILNYIVTPAVSTEPIHKTHNRNTFNDGINNHSIVRFLYFQTYEWITKLLSVMFTSFTVLEW